MKKNPENKKLKSAIVPYRDISVDVENSEMSLSFPNICRDLIHQKMFEEMVHTRLWLGTRQQVTLCWWNDPNMQEYLVMDKYFDRFWNEAVPNRMGFIELEVSVICIEDENDAEMKQSVDTPRKNLGEYSIESPRRSPRIAGKMGKSVQGVGYEQVGTARKLSFVSLLKKFEYDGLSCLIQASVGDNMCNVGSNSQPLRAIEDEGRETFNHDYWTMLVQDHTVLHDDYNVQLQNVDVDECHPVEEMEPPLLFDSDEDERDYREFGTFYEGEFEDDDSDEEEVNEKHGGIDAQYDEEEAKEPEWFQKFVEEKKVHFEKEKEEPQFPEDEEVEQVDPSMMLLGTRFAKQEDFKRHLRAFCVLNETQFLVRSSYSRRVKVIYRFHEEYKCPWFVFCSRRKKGGYWSITSLEEKHTCDGDPSGRNKSANKYFVCDWVKDRLKTSAGKVIPKPGQIKEDFFTQTNINIPYQTAWKARNLVLESQYGNYEESFNNVPTFCNMVTKTNEGSVAIYTYAHDDDCFESMTIYFAAKL